MERQNTIWRILLLAIPLAVFSIFIVWPLLNSFYYSFTNWNGFNAEYDFVGLKNFSKVLTTRLFTNAAINTLIWMVAAIVLPSLAGLGLALLLDSKIRGANVFKSIFYLPICLSAIVVGQIWVWIFQPDWGLLNIAISAISGEPFTYAWLAKPGSAIYAVIVAWSWQQTGLSMVIFLAGLTGIPQDLTEVAEIEGAAAAAPCHGGGHCPVGDQFAQGVRYSLHHDRRRAIQFVGYAGHVHVQRILQEIPDGLWKRDFGHSVPDHTHHHLHLFSPTQESR